MQVRKNGEPMNGKSRRDKFYAILDIALPIATLLAVLAIYAIIGKVVGIEMITPSIGKVAGEFFSLFSQASFYKAVGGTLARATLAYLLSFASAALLAMLTKAFPPLRRALSPLIILVRIMPTMSIILLALIWFNSYQSTVLVAFCVIFPMLYTSFCDGAESVDKDLVQMSKVYGVDKRSLILRLYIPQMLPTVFTGLKSSVGLNLKLIIAAEVLAQTAESMGVYMQLANINLDTATLLAWTAVAIILGGIFEGLVALAEKRTVKGR